MGFNLVNNYLVRIIEIIFKIEIKKNIKFNLL